jgi:hypothetical protein
MLNKGKSSKDGDIVRFISNGYDKKLFVIGINYTIYIIFADASARL